MNKTPKENTYFDYNASAPLRPSVVSEMTEAMKLVGNPSSVHKNGRQARRILSESRNTICDFVGAHNSKLIFTSGGTESNNLALHGLKKTKKLVSSIEHESILAAANEGIRIPVHSDGLVNLSKLQSLLAAQPGPTLVSVMLANNETGVIQPLDKISSIVHQFDGLVHCDGVQALGKLDINMDALGIDLLSLSPHKVGGPKGVGALVISNELNIDAQLVGGGQEFSVRAGTENFISISGFAATCRDMNNNKQELQQILTMRKRLENNLKNGIPDVQIHCAQSPRLINTTSVRMRGIPAETQVIAMDLAGVSVSAGSACSSGKVTTSHVLLAMGLSCEAANETTRLSIGWATTEADIDYAAKVWLRLQKRALSGQTPKV